MLLGTVSQTPFLGLHGDLISDVKQNPRLYSAPPKPHLYPPKVSKIMAQHPQKASVLHTPWYCYGGYFPRSS